MVLSNTPNAPRLTIGLLWLGFVIAALAGAFVGNGDGGEPMPLAARDPSAMLLLVAQAIVVAIMLTIPGLELLCRLNAGRLPDWPLALIAGAAAMLSCGVVTIGVMAAAYVFKTPWAAYACIAALAAMPFVAHNALRQFAARLRDGMTRRHLAAMGAIVVFYLALAAVTASTVYPQIRTYGAFAAEVELGDAPAYCRAAANLASTGQLTEDYFIGDYVGGVYGYIPRMSLVPVALTAACYWLFGVNVHSMFVVHLFLGMMMAIVAAFVAMHGRADRRLGGFVVFALLFACPVVCFQVALGSHGVIPALAAMVLISLSQLEHDRSGTAVVVFVLVTTLLPIVHPIGTLLMGAVLITCVVVVALRARRRVVWSSTVGGMLVAGALLFCITLGRGMSIADNSVVTLNRFDASTGAFRPTVTPYSERCRHLSAANFSGTPTPSLSNLELGEEILAHPLAYATFVSQAAWECVAAMGRDFVPYDSWDVVAVLLLVAVAAMRRDQRAYVAAAVIYCYALGWANAHAGTRHRLCVLMPLLVLAGRSLMLWMAQFRTVHQHRRAIAMVLALLAIVPAIHWARQTHEVRRYWKNRDSAQLVTTLLEMADRPASVAGRGPQLLACLTGARCVGGTWFGDHLDGLVERFEPEWIVVDRYNYQKITARATPDGYAIAFNDESRCHLILRRQPPSGEPVPGIALGATLSSD